MSREFTNKQTRNEHVTNKETNELHVTNHNFPK